MAAELTEESQQQIEWRARLVRAILERAHDNETLLAMLEAGLEQAYSEGLLDAAEICDRVSTCAPAAVVAPALAKAIRSLDRMNRELAEHDARASIAIRGDVVMSEG